MHWRWPLRVSPCTALEYLTPLEKLKGSLLHCENKRSCLLRMGGVWASSKPYLSLTCLGVRRVVGKDEGKVVYDEGGRGGGRRGEEEEEEEKEKEKEKDKEKEKEEEQ